MKPKTKLQIEVYKLEKKLPDAEKKHYDWMRENLFEFYVYRTKKQNECLECGHIWNGDTLLCPNCNRKLKPLEGKSRTLKDDRYFAIFTTFHGFQVLRYFYIIRTCKSKEHIEYFVREVFQHWINDKGDDTIFAVKVNAFSWARFDGWSLDPTFEIRHSHDRYFIWDVPIYPRPRFLPILKRNGFKGKFHNTHPCYMFSIILKSPIHETLLKARQYELFAYHRGDGLNKYWNQIKICIRNNYIIKDANSWFDHLELLKEFNKDINNPKYICPENFELAHQQLINKKTKKKVEELRKQKREENEKYRMIYKNFLNLKFNEGDITIKVLQDIPEFMQEGEELNHCVYSSEYYKRYDSLILSARKENERLETIELSLRQMRVVQCRGKGNLNTVYHSQILKLMNKNINKIKKIANKQTA